MANGKRINERMVAYSNFRAVLFSRYDYAAVTCERAERLSIWRSIRSIYGDRRKEEKRMILIGASVLTGAAVSVSGAIGFVGLVIPHVVRLVAGANHKHVLPLSILIGGSYLVLADLLARTILEPRELPIGVVTALIGSPILRCCL